MFAKKCQEVQQMTSREATTEGDDVTIMNRLQADLDMQYQLEHELRGQLDEAMQQMNYKDQ